MTLAVAVSSTPQSTGSQVVPIVVLGTDALLAALPATPVQLAHACLRAGFASVVPASWGDELIAAAALRRLSEFGPRPVIQCSCPIVAHRLLTVGGDLRPAMLTLVSPPVAIARYVRAHSRPMRTRITYVGACPGANDDAIDIRMRPDALLALLADRDIVLDDQPRVFESIIPPDRRRFRSQPGGLPATEALWTGAGARTLVELDGEDIVVELAQELLTGKNVLIDVAPHVGCVCAGAVAGVRPANARANAIECDPPRASGPIVDEQVAVDLDLPVPAASRTPIDVVAVPPRQTPARPLPTPPQGLMPFGHRISPVHGFAAVPEPRPSRISGPIVPRSPLAGSSAAPTGESERRSLPRAYVARRRSSPRGMPAITLPPDDSVPSETPSRPAQPVTQAVATPPASTPVTRAETQAASAVPPVLSPTAPIEGVTPSLQPAIGVAEPRQQTALLSTRQIVLIIAAILLLTVSASTIVAVTVARSVRAAPASAPVPR